MSRGKISDDADKINRFDEKIARLAQKKLEYIKLWEERRKRHTPKLQKTISAGLSHVSKRLEMIKKWERRKTELDERIKVLELQIVDRRKVIQKAQEKLREYETCEPGISERTRKEKESNNE